MTDQLTVDYQGTEAFPDGGTPPRTFEGVVRVAVTAVIVLVPFGGRGGDPWQIDISASVIRIFERFGWATGVHWPAPARLDSRRRDQGQPRSRPAPSPRPHVTLPAAAGPGPS